MTNLGSSTVLITGAASGMGRGLVGKVLAAGGDAVAWDMDEAGLASLHEEAESQPGTVRTHVVNVTDREAVDAAAAEVGDVDILINNAGIVGDGSRLWDADPNRIELVMNVNALALFWTTRAFIRPMIERNSGHLVTIASAAGLVPLRGAVAYTASKHAAVGFHDSLRHDIKDKAPDIKMTLVTPFFINTGMFDGTKSRFDFLLPIVEPEDAVNRIVKAVEGDDNRVIMPAMATAAYAYRLLPSRVGDALLEAFGIANSMDEFKGRN